MRSWRLAIVPALVLSLAVMIGTVTQFIPTKEAYYLLGSLVAGYSSYVIALKIKQEALCRMGK
jgi:hypothetical protein